MPTKSKQVSQAPTRPRPAAERHAFDVADLYSGPLGDAAPRDAEGGAPLDEKLRQAYFWVVNHAIISPFYDIEFQADPPAAFALGARKVPLCLPTAQSYSSYVLLPLLNLAVRRRCLLVGGPGRGKTVIATLLALLAGYSLREVRQGIQHGQPQMTIADLLGNPLPSSLVSAKSMDEIQIAWRKWLGMRVKIIDEYNRIPTRTQSALLTVMGDDYAEIYDQIFECPPAAWYLTANDDAGGGTYQVIEALRDRIDVVVKALHFNTRFLGALLERIEEGVKPEDAVPEEIVFSPAELDRIEREVRAIPLATGLQKRIAFFASELEFFEPAARRLEYMTKDTVKVAGVPFESLGELEDPTSIGAQTRNGLSVRALMTCLVFAKALAYFRGNAEVGFEDVRQILPFVLHDKLVQHKTAPAFDAPEHAAYRSDLVSWIRMLFDRSCQEYDRLDRDRSDPCARELELFERGLEGLGERAVDERLAAIERALRDVEKGGKLYGHLYDDVLALKYLHQRYTNYRIWLRCRA
ncbi:MAG: AAA family ATPase [Myxococcales bacterium]|nr:AAA family ATPase [Myxococcales bacterium]